MRIKRLAAVALACRHRWNFQGYRSFVDVSDQHPKEHEWVRQDGDRAAFAHLVRHHQESVHRFIHRMLGSREEALELTQETSASAKELIAQLETMSPQGAL